MQSNTMILLRTTWIDPILLSYAEELRQASGVNVSLLVDNRKNPPIEPASNIVPLNDSSFDELNLFTMDDVGWRCGDYGMYLARRQFPAIEHFWIIEDNLRIDGNINFFFQFFQEKKDIDFLAGKYKKAYSGWYWWPFAQSRDAIPYQCQFSIVRLSAKALDLMYAKRKAQSRMFTRKIMWPNDESFVATTMANSKLSSCDINGFGFEFYGESYNLEAEQKLKGGNGFPRIVHPVALERQAPINAIRSAHDRYTRRDGWLSRKKKAVARYLNCTMSW